MDNGGLTVLKKPPTKVVFAWLNAFDLFIFSVYVISPGSPVEQCKVKWSLRMHTHTQLNQSGTLVSQQAGGLALITTGFVPDEMTDFGSAGSNEEFHYRALQVLFCLLGF